MIPIDALARPTAPTTGALTPEQQQQRNEKQAPKTHRERVEEYNSYLSRLSEHNDMYATSRTAPPGEAPALIIVRAGRALVLAKACHISSRHAHAFASALTSIRSSPPLPGSTNGIPPSTQLIRSR